jgi:hypothetical protein
VDSQDSRVALIQYVDAATIRPYWNKVLSSLAKVKFVSPTLNTNVGLKMRLIYRNDLPPTLGNAEPITGWDVNGDPEFDPSWGEILPLNDPTYTLENGSNFVDLSFDQFQMPPAENATMYLGVVIYTTEPFVSTPGSKDQLIFDSVSLVNNDFAIASPSKTFDQVLQECQFYYEVAPAYLYRTMSVNRAGSSFSGFASPFNIEFNSLKRTSATASPSGITLTLISNIGTAGNVTARYYQDGLLQGGANSNINRAVNSYWFTPLITTKGAKYETGSSPGDLAAGASYTDNASAGILFAYTADARLGN